MKYKTKKIVIKHKRYNYYFSALNLYLLSDWVDNACSFCEGFGKVRKGEKYNYVKQDGTFLLDEWVESACSFNEGFGLVMKDGKHNYVRPGGTFLLDEWVDYAWYFQEGLGKIRKDKKENYVRPDGTFLLDEWADNISRDKINNETCITVINIKNTDNSIEKHYVDINGNIIHKR